MSNPSPSKDELRQVFDRFDANGDGRISSEELAGVLNALGSAADATSSSEVARVMKEVDADCDGFISLDEFAAFYSAGGAGADAPELRDAFEMYDQDKNGLISAVELHQILIRLGEKFTVDDCSRMIKSFDSDGDGNICFEEFKKMMAKPSDSGPPPNSK